MSEQNRDIKATLQVLGIDTDLSPEDAAAAAADGIDESESESEGGEGEGGDEGARGTPASSTVVTVEDTPLPSADVAIVPPPKLRKPRTPPGSPSAGKMGKGLADKVPGAEKIKVYKREETTSGAPGKRWFIGDYNRADLSGFSDFESFLTTYVKPKYKSGEYDLVGLDAHGREVELGTVRLIADPTEVKGDGSLNIVSAMLAQQKERDEQWLKNMKESLRQPTPQDPLQLMAGMMTLQKQMNQESEAGMSQTMQMMMAMMQQNQQMMMAILSKPKEEDPIMKALLVKLVEEKTSGGGAALPPPPPPPPAVDIPALITALGSIMGGGGGGDDDFKEFMKTLLVSQQADKLSTKDVIQLLTAKNENQPDSLRKAVDDLAAIMNVAQNINKSQEGGAAAGFFDALAALFSNRDFAGSIANTIRAKTDKGVSIEQQRLMAERQRLEMQKRLLAREAQQIQQAAQQPTPVVQQTLTQAPPVRVVEAAPRQTSEQVQKAAERTIARTGKLPQLPANTHEHVNNIAAAADEGELVGRTIQMLIYFAEFDDWRPFTEQILGHVRDGNKQDTLTYLTALFEGLAAIHLIDPVLAQKVVRSMMSNFDVIQAQLRDVPLETDKEITGDALMNNGEANQSAVP